MTTTDEQLGVIWDFDGTLVDTMPTHFGAWQQFMEAHDRAFSQEQFMATSGKSAEEIIQAYFEDATAEDLARLGDQKNTFYREAADRNGIIFMPGAEELLKALQQAGFKQAIGSGTPRKNLELAYRQHPWLRTYFEVAVVAGDTPHSKPDPEVFLLAARSLGVAPENCLVIEDGLLGIEAAQRAGMRSVAVIGPDQHGEDFLARGAARVFASLQELDAAAVLDLIKSGKASR